MPAYMLAAVPVAINLPGFLLSAFPVAFTSVPGPFVRLYDWVWFFGVALALAIHTGLMTVRRGTLATA